MSGVAKNLKLNLNTLDHDRVEIMHVRREATVFAKGAGRAGRATMAVDALWILALGQHATGRLTRNEPDARQLGRRGLVIVLVRAVGSVRTVTPQVVHVAHLHRLDALDVEAVVLELGVDTLALAVPRDRVAAAAHEPRRVRVRSGGRGGRRRRRQSPRLRDRIGRERDGSGESLGGDGSGGRTLKCQVLLQLDLGGLLHLLLLLMLLH